MKRIFTALIFALFACSAASAQGCGPSNPNCIVADRPAGDSTGAAANTKFVTGAIAAAQATNVVGPVSSTVGHLATWNNTTGTVLADSTVLPTITAPSTFSPASGAAITVTPTGSGTGIGVTVPSGLATGLVVNNPSPSGVLSSFALNSFNCGLVTSDAIDAAATPANNCLLVAHRIGGSKGGRQTLAVQTVVTAAPAAGDTLPQWVSGSFLGQGNVNAGGAGIALLSQTNGAIYPINPIAKLINGATNYSDLGAEFDLEVNTGASVWYTHALSLITTAGHSVSGAFYDTLLALSAQSGSVGSNFGILFGPMNSAHPVKSTGTLIGVTNLNRTGSGTVAATVANGIDFSLYTISTCAFKIAAGCVVDGSANISTSGTIISTNATNSTTTTTGAVKLSGGLGVVGSINGGISVSAWDNTVQTAIKSLNGSSVGQVGTVSNHALQVIVNNAPVAAFVAGMQIGSPTGGDKGTGTINAQAAYFANGTTGVTCNAGISATTGRSINGIITAC